MAGRHLATRVDRDAAADYPAGIPHGDDAGREHLVGPGARISRDTSVTVDMEAMPIRPEVTPSSPNPDALVENGLVGDGTEME